MRKFHVFSLMLMLSIFPGKLSLGLPLLLNSALQSQDPCSKSIHYAPLVPEHTPIKTLRIAFHVFTHSSGEDSFSNDPLDILFLENTVDWLNSLLSDLPPLEPQNSPDITSPHIPDSRIRLHLDTIYFWEDDYVHEYFTRDGIVRRAAAHAHKKYVLENPDLNEIQKYNTLHIIISGNHPTTGGQVSGIGDKDFMLFKGWYHAFERGRPAASTGIFIHELGHSMGLRHHYGPRFCRQCNDLGCYELGETNNIMALYPSSLRAMSECQLGIAHYHLNGKSGNIGDVVIYDPCSLDEEGTVHVKGGGHHIWNSPRKLPGNLVIHPGTTLTINCRLTMPDQGRIIIHRGGRINVDPGLIENGCGGPWDGMEYR